MSMATQVQQTEQTEQRETIRPLTGPELDAVYGGTSAQITSRPQNYAFRPERMMLR